MQTYQPIKFMKKIILFICITSFTACDTFFQLNPDKELAEKIKLEYVREKKPVDLMKVTNFDWDNYLLMFAYEVPEQVGKNYKVDLSNISEYITADESKYILVFLKNKKAVKICVFRGGVGFNKNKKLKME